MPRDGRPLPPRDGRPLPPRDDGRPLPPRDSRPLPAAGCQAEEEAPADLICIESDDEAADAGPPGAWAAPWAELPGADATAAPALICCQLFLVKQAQAPTRCRGSSQGAKPPQRRMVQLPGAVSVALRQPSEVGGDADEGPLLEFVRLRNARLPSCSSNQDVEAFHVPVASVASVEIRSEGRLAFLRLREEIDTGGVGSAVDAPSRFREMALRPRANEVASLMAAVRWWLPDACVRQAVQQPLRLDGIELTARDVKLLESEKCLNDSILDFFLRLIVEVVAPERLRGDLYVASTFFFQKLTSGGVASGEEGWENVQRWTRSLEDGLLAKRFVIVPINELNLHWWLAVICHPGRVLSSVHDSMKLATLGEAPRIVCLDSAQEPPPKGTAVQFLRGYIWREWRERWRAGGAAGSGSPSGRPARAPGREEADKALKAVEADVPKQANHYDCGLFILEYVVHLLQSRSALGGLGLAPHRHWFTQPLVSHRRRRLQWLAGHLQQRAQRLKERDVARLLEDQELRATVRRALTDDPKASKRSLDAVEEAARPAPPAGAEEGPRPPAGAPPEPAGKRLAPSPPAERSAVAGGRYLLRERPAPAGALHLGQPLPPRPAAATGRYL